MSLTSAKKLLMAAGGGVLVDTVFGVHVPSTGEPGVERQIPIAPHLSWQKALQNDGSAHQLFDVERGRGVRLGIDTAAQSSQGTAPTAGVDGVNKSYGAGVRAPLVAYNFRRSPRFMDVVAYTGDGVAGRKIPHGLRRKPGMILIKRSDAVTSWYVYHRSPGAAFFAELNRGDDGFRAGQYWNNVEPSSLDFTVNSDTAINASGGRYIAYLFAHDDAPQGIIRCGSYQGNGSSDGPVISLGWEPQWLLVRKLQHDPSQPNSDWLLWDSKRAPSNPRNSGLAANVPTTTTYTASVDFTATGFKVRTDYSMMNTSGLTYLYMAIRKGSL